LVVGRYRPTTNEKREKRKIMVPPERATLIFQPVTNLNVENIFRPKSLPPKTLQESENILFEKSQPFRYIQDMLKIYIRTYSRDVFGDATARLAT